MIHQRVVQPSSDPDRLEKWAVKNINKFNRRECRARHTGRKNSRHAGDQQVQERTWGCWQNPYRKWTSNVLFQQRWLMVSWDASRTAASRSKEVMLALCSALVFRSMFPSTRETLCYWRENLAKSHEDNEGTAVSLLWGKIEKVWTFQPGEEEVQQRSFQCTPEVSVQKRLCPAVFSDRRSNVNKLEHTGFQLTTKKHFFTVRWPNTDTGFSEKLQSLLLEVTQKGNGLGLRHPALSIPALERTSQMTSRYPFQSQPFFNLVISPTQCNKAWHENK